jgi:hypothetical protein
MNLKKKEKVKWLHKKINLNYSLNKCFLGYYIYFISKLHYNVVTACFDFKNS